MVIPREAQALGVVINLMQQNSNSVTILCEGQTSRSNMPTFIDL